jgi:hypothetical protein
LQAEKTRSSVVAKILNQTEDVSELRDAMKESRPAIPTPMLDVVFKSGAIISFSYAYLTRIDFDPVGKLDLHFGDDVVVIEGRNLFDMRQKIRLHRADEIAEGLEAEGALKPENSAHVERIQIVSDSEMKREAKGNDGAKHKGIER